MAYGIFTGIRKLNTTLFFQAKVRKINFSFFRKKFGPYLWLSNFFIQFIFEPYSNKSFASFLRMKNFRHTNQTNFSYIQKMVKIKIILIFLNHFFEHNWNLFFLRIQKISVEDAHLTENTKISLFINIEKHLTNQIYRIIVIHLWKNCFLSYLFISFTIKLEIFNFEK